MNKKMQNLGKRVLLPFLRSIERRLHADFGDRLPKSEITTSLYAVCNTSREVGEESRHSAYQLFCEANREKVKRSLVASDEEQPSQQQVFSELGRRWTQAKASGKSKKYENAYQVQRRERLSTVSGSDE